MSSFTQITMVLPLAAALLGAACSLAWRGSARLCLALGYGATALAGVLATLAALRVLFGAAPERVALFKVLPGTDLALRLSPLGAFFWLLCGLAVAAVSIFAVGYARHY